VADESAARTLDTDGWDVGRRMEDAAGGGAGRRMQGTAVDGGGMVICLWSGWWWRPEPGGRGSARGWGDLRIDSGGHRSRHVEIVQWYT
jgi:hypothetical protein